MEKQKQKENNTPNTPKRKTRRTLKNAKKTEENEMVLLFLVTLPVDCRVELFFLISVFDYVFVALSFC